MEIETTIEIKPDEIKSDHMKTIDPLDIKESSTTPTKPSLYYEKPLKKTSSYYEQPNADLMK